jgi:hypothetical protein
MEALENCNDCPLLVEPQHCVESENAVSSQGYSLRYMRPGPEGYSLRYMRPGPDCPYVLLAEKDADLARLRDACVDAAAHLAAAISLLERGGEKAAPSNKMFRQMMEDYKASLKRTRAAVEGGE